jgi:hypothetical protein
MEMQKKGTLGRFPFWEKGKLEKRMLHFLFYSTKLSTCQIKQKKGAPMPERRGYFRGFLNTIACLTWWPDHLATA